MNRFICASVPAVAAALLVACGSAAQAATFTLTPITNTTPNFAGPILINGTVTMGAGETMYSPNVWSSHGMPFLSNYSAGFNGSGQQFDPAFIAWNGVGSYSGPILNHQVSANNLGYSGGMPLGLYGSNVFGPGGQAFITLHYIGTDGLDHAVNLTFAINVVPTPGTLALLGAGGLVGARRRRR